MSKTKHTPSDRRGSRTQRNPRDFGPERRKPSKQPFDGDAVDEKLEVSGDSDGAVDDEMELDTSKYERPIQKG